VTLPAGYLPLRAPGASGFVWSEAAGAVEEAISRHGTLRRWAEEHERAIRFSGRGTVTAFEAPAPGPDHRTQWVLRPYLRGGAVARLLRDRYLREGNTRPHRELTASAAARARGIPTPAVVAGAVYPAGPFHYRADLVTELVPDGLDLAEALRRGGDPGPLLQAADVLLARAASAGIFHPDLNAKNVVIRSEPAGPVAYLIDLDRCRVRPRAAAADEKAMRTRLERSLAKLATSDTVPPGAA